jgi:tripartite-type tricarboxylate transporter receptor subunit TctC
MSRPRPSLATIRTGLIAATLLGAFVAATAVAAAQGNYPSRLIKIVVPVPPGAFADTLPRVIGEKLAALWGQPVIIENRPGAASNLGAEAVAKAAPDGYTLLATPPGPLVVNQSLYAKLPFDPETFVPVTVMAALPYVLLANPALPFSNVAEFVAYAKANPDKLNFGSAGIGSPPHLAMEWLKTLAGIRMTHVPYRGSGPALADLVAGHVGLMFDNVGNPVPLIRDGKVRALGVASEQPIAALPDVAPIAETFPSFKVTTWFAIVAPPKTPPEIAAKLSSAFGEILRMPDVVRRIHDSYGTPVGGSPADTATLIRTETERWRAIVQAAGIKPE